MVNNLVCSSDKQENKADITCKVSLEINYLYILLFILLHVEYVNFKKLNTLMLTQAGECE